MSEAAEQNAGERKSAAGPKVLDYLWVALALAILTAIAATLAKDPKPKFQFPDPPKPAPEATPAASPVAMAGTDVIEGASAPLQSLFADAQQEQRGQSLFIDGVEPPFVAPTPVPVNRPREMEMGRAYQELSRRDSRALDRVAKLGGYGTPDRMAAAFGYLSVNDMVAAWTRSEAEGNPFRASEAPPAN